MKTHKIACIPGDGIGDLGGKATTAQETQSLCDRHA